MPTALNSLASATAIALAAILASAVSCQKLETSAPSTPELRDIGKIVINGEALRAMPMPGRREGRVDIAKTIARVADAGADCFVFAIGDGDHDWDDFKLLAAAADKQKLKLWISIRLPNRQANSQPYLGSYEKWSSAIADVATKHESVVACLLPELEQGRNPKFMHPARCGTMREALNANGVSLLGSVFDPDEPWVEMYENSVDGIVVRWTKFNQLLNLSGMVAGMKALCPSKWKLLFSFETRAWGGSPQPPDAALTGASLNVAMKRVDGVVLRSLDLAQPATILPTKDGNGAHFKALKSFTSAYRKRKTR